MANICLCLLVTCLITIFTKGNATQVLQFNVKAYKYKMDTICDAQRITFANHGRSALDCARKMRQSQHPFFFFISGVCYATRKLCAPLVASEDSRMFVLKRQHFLAYSLLANQYIKVYSTYMAEGSNFVVSEELQGSPKVFRSDSVMSLIRYFTGPMNITVTMGKKNSRLKESEAHLSFHVSSGGSSDIQSWFKKSNLVSSHPWNLQILRNLPSYHYFRIVGNVASTLERRFVIIKRYPGYCSLDTGIMMITQKAFCSWEMGTPAVLVYAHDGNGGIGTFISHTRRAQEFKIYVQI